MYMADAISSCSRRKSGRAAWSARYYLINGLAWIAIFLGRSSSYMVNGLVPFSGVRQELSSNHFTVSMSTSSDSSNDNLSPSKGPSDPQLLRREALKRQLLELADEFQQMRLEADQQALEQIKEDESKRLQNEQSKNFVRRLLGRIMTKVMGRKTTKKKGGSKGTYAVHLKRNQCSEE